MASLTAPPPLSTLTHVNTAVPADDSGRRSEGTDNGRVLLEDELATVIARTANDGRDGRAELDENAP